MSNEQATESERTALPKLACSVVVTCYLPPMKSSCEAVPTDDGSQHINASTTQANAIARWWRGFGCCDVCVCVCVCTRARVVGLANDRAFGVFLERRHATTRT